MSRDGVRFDEPPRLVSVSQRIVLVALCSLVLTACGGEKISADETATELNNTYPGPNWRCIEGRNGWDYLCGKVGLSDAQLERQGIGVEVDSNSVVERSAP